MTRHAEFTVRTGLPVYFCDPHSHSSAALTRTPKGFSGNIFRRVPTCPCTPKKNLIE